MRYKILEDYQHKSWTWVVVIETDSKKDTFWAPLPNINRASEIRCRFSPINMQIVWKFGETWICIRLWQQKDNEPWRLSDLLSLMDYQFVEAVVRESQIHC